MLRPNEILIHSGNAHQFVTDPRVGGEVKKRGQKPRPWQHFPCGSIPGVPRASVPKIPRSEWSERIRDLVGAKALLSDIRNIGMSGSPIPSRDQNGRGYCWAHSTVSAAVLARAKDNQPYADLSAYAIACIIKGYRDEGGWNGESMQFLRERGCPTSEFWAQKSTQRSNDNPNTWANAALHKMTEWDDIPDRDFDQLMTYLLLLCPAAIDENWWGHSICAADPVDGASTFGIIRGDSGKLLTASEFDSVWEVDRYGGAYGVRIWNSWGDEWSDRGMGILTESKSTPDGAVACRSITASVA